MKQYRKILVLVALVLCTMLLSCVERSFTGNLSTQQLAKRWSKEETFAQLACYFTRDAFFYEDQIQAVERGLITAMQEAAIDAEKGNGGRNWLDAYSTEGELVISSSRASVSVRAFGVGGDFFQFHPLTLLDGNYFDASDVNEDGVVIDEVVAWQLFGSNNVSGMEIEINGAVYPVRGVVRSDVGMFSEAVEEEAATIYVSFGILEGSDGALPIDTYEVLIANPVKGFGKEALKNALGIAEEDYELIECSARFDLAHRIDVLKNFGVRSMVTKNIVFPYWENRARGYEDISGLILVLETLCMGYPVFWLLQQGCHLWKRRKEGKKIVWQWLKKTMKKVKLIDKKTEKRDM